MNPLHWFRSLMNIIRDIRNKRRLRKDFQQAERDIMAKSEDLHQTGSHDSNHIGGA